MAKVKSSDAIEPSSGNVFADLGLPDAAELDTKMRLAIAINQRLLERKLTPASAAAVLSINQPKVSALKGYKLDGFSMDGLMTFLTALGSDVEIKIHSHSSGKRVGRIVVLPA